MTNQLAKNNNEGYIMVNRIKMLLSVFLYVLILSACSNPNKLTSTEQAQLIRLAINDNNVNKLQRLSALPVFVREQEWVTANDGYGFVLGSAKQAKLLTNLEFMKYFKSSINSIHIESEKVIAEDITLSLFADELSEQIQHWNNLNLHLLVRGEGDVEHIVLLGLEKETNKFRAIYIN